MMFFLVGILVILSIGIVFLTSFYLLVQIMVWRKRGWEAAQWIRTFWIGWALLIIGCLGLWIAQSLGDSYPSLGLLTLPCYLLILVSPFCQLYAFVRFFQEGAALKREEQQALMKRRGDLETTGVWPPPPTND